MIGTVLKERYRIDQRLGQGAFGEVYRATDLREQEPVAIKTMRADIIDVADYRKRFAREVLVLRKLHHANIVSYIDAFASENQAFLVMEYVGGGTLDGFLRTHKQLPLGQFKGLILKVLDAIATAHEAGAIHRDLKPGNILMTATGEPKIADFGLVKLAELSTMTATEVMMGTLLYMPPEAFDALHPKDHRADIWALGVIIFEMLTGLHPFRGKTQAELIAAILQDTPTQLSTIRRDVPPAWNDIVLRCLMKNPFERYESVRGLQEDIRYERLSPSNSSLTMMAEELDFGESLVILEGTPEDAPSPLRKLIDKTPAQADPPAADKALVVRPENKFGQYSLRFVKALDGVPEESHVPPGAARPVRGRYIPSSEELMTPVTPSKTPMGILLLGGAFVWIGIAFSILGAILFILPLIPESESFQAERGVIAGLQIVGGLAFMIGLIFEAIYSEREVERMLLGLVATGMIAVWILFYSGQLFRQSFITAIIAMMATLALITLFFNAKKVG